MKKKLKVLHIASFIGNIGDNANHKGSKKLREMYLDYEFETTEKEIRAFFWRDWIFNSEEFIAEANQYDLLMIGGGNYFELWVKDSATGTSIDLSNITLEKIKTPILFYSLGCDIGQGVPEGNIEKFGTFLDKVTSDNRYYVSVRNDGAMSNIRSLYGLRYEDKISEIPDGGFFTYVEDYEHVEIDESNINIAINIAGDMEGNRFQEQKGDISYDQFITSLANVIGELHEERNGTINFILVPHIFRDLRPIYDLLDLLKDNIRRSYVKVAPYLTGDKGHDYIFSLYKQSDLILGMRFHANVCAYAMKKNVIGLSNYIQVNNLYNQIDSEEFVEVNKKDYHIKLKHMIVTHLDDSKKYVHKSENIVSKIASQTEKEYQKINEWLNINFDGR